MERIQPICDCLTSALAHCFVIRPAQVVQKLEIDPHQMLLSKTNLQSMLWSLCGHVDDITKVSQ